MRAAIIDIGTNTFNLLVGERGPTLSILHSEERPVFLGQGGMEHGIIAEDAMERGMVVLREFARQAAEMGVERINAFGTSALRNARNAHVFVGRAREQLGIDITVIAGEKEADLILAGVRQAVSFTAKPMLVMDIGGGSIEFILATDRATMWKRSFELGMTRLRERFDPSDPLTIEEQFRIGQHLDHHLEPLWAVMDRHWPAALVGSAGSFDTLAAMVAAERGTTIEAGDRTFSFDHVAFDNAKERLLPMSRAERLLIPGLPAYRVDTIALAMLAIERVLMRGIGTLHWSRYALKEGAAMDAWLRPTMS
jgi:exopolyphosphatase/guanosine-5'-triphosphate,3'-diphosphate pyrophosphatase